MMTRTRIENDDDDDDDDDKLTTSVFDVLPIRKFLPIRIFLRWM